MENKPIPTKQELQNSSPLQTFSNSDVWIKGYVLRQTSDNGLIPISVFFDPTNGRILTNTLPPEIRSEYEGKTINDNPSTTSWGSDSSYERTEIDQNSQFHQPSNLGAPDSSQWGQDNQQSQQWGQDNQQSQQWGQDNQQQTPNTNWEWK